MARQMSDRTSPQPYAVKWAGVLSDLDVEMDPGSAGRVHPQPDRVGGLGPLRRERAVHDRADLALEVSGTHHFRDRLVFLPGERGGYLGLNGVPGNRRRFADADMRAAASCEPPSGRRRNDDGQNVPFAFEHAITPHVDHPEMHDIPSPGLRPAQRRRPLTVRARSQSRTLSVCRRKVSCFLIRRPRRFTMPLFSKGHVDIRRTAAYSPGRPAISPSPSGPLAGGDSGARTGEDAASHHRYGLDLACPPGPPGSSRIPARGRTVRTLSTERHFPGRTGSSHDLMETRTERRLLGDCLLSVV